MTQKTLNRIAFKIAILYAVFGLLWIFFSDGLLGILVTDPDLRAAIQSIKGGLFIALTAVLVYLLVARYVRQGQMADERLHQTQNLYRDFIEKTDDLVTQVDGQGRFTFVNRKSNAVLGKAPEDCIGLSSFDFIHPDDRENTVAKFHDALKRKLKNVEFENRQLSISGKETRLLWMTNIHYLDNGEIDSINSIGHDITQRKQLQETLLQTEKMVSIGGLAAGMAHEINNPMAGILQSAQLLQNRLLKDSAKNAEFAKQAGLSLEVLRRYLELQKSPQLLSSIRESGERVARIVSDLLEFSSRRSIEPVPFDMPDLIEQTLGLASKELDLSAHFDFRQIEIVREYAEGLPEIRCDRTQIQQVLLNMLRNGAHAMLTWPNKERQAQFYLRVRVVGGYMEIQIEDNGIGMDEETRNHIFEPFFTTKSVGQGTGLGLFVAYFVVVEKHGGKLQVQSEVGEGTCFTIHLPLS